MELCNGDLRQFLEQRYDTETPTPLYEATIWNIFIQILVGLEFLHSRGFVHGNLKPKNGVSICFFAYDSSVQCPRQ